MIRSETDFFFFNELWYDEEEEEEEKEGERGGWKIRRGMLV